MNVVLTVLKMDSRHVLHFVEYVGNQVVYNGNDRPDKGKAVYADECINGCFLI